MFLSTLYFYSGHVYIYIYQKEEWVRADLCRTPLKNSLTGDTLFPILINCLSFFLEVRAEPFIFYAPYAIVVDFSWWYIVIDCIKSCFQINKKLERSIFLYVVVSVYFQLFTRSVFCSDPEHFFAYTLSNHKNT